MYCNLTYEYRKQWPLSLYSVIRCLLLGRKRLSVIRRFVSSDQQVWWTIQLFPILVDSITQYINIFNARYKLDQSEWAVAFTSIFLFNLRDRIKRVGCKIELLKILMGSVFPKFFRFFSNKYSLALWSVSIISGGRSVVIVNWAYHYISSSSMTIPFLPIIS